MRRARTPGGNRRARCRGYRSFSQFATGPAGDPSRYGSVTHPRVFPSTRRARRAVALAIAGVALALMATAVVGAPVPRPAATCPVGRTAGVFAHQDDDILFANPAIAGRIARGECVFTLYLSAGDAGEPAQYWIGREAGSRAAYARMAGVPDRWVRHLKSVHGRSVITYSLRANPRISLGFLRLPDGLNRGTGFPSTGNRSLFQLWTGVIDDIWTTDGVHYTRDELVRVVRALVLGFAPRQVITNDFTRPFQCQPDSCVRPFDHSDHVATGYITRAAVPGLFRKGAVLGAKGYPAVFENLPNVADPVLARKTAIFAAYTAHDPLVCQGATACLDDVEYGNFLRRQYLIPSAAPR